ncbi:TPA: flagellar filament capping protein FliD [Enterobacter cancerogenus]|jgi:flagellar hook-associated protein 2|uniref:Flagellar hook-associated protein 2 n=1 Tax=Enterobacter cancerogenus TaxID=69218 RepID=A0ABX8KQF7_9ENTR|nr:flagellar filament capping protein FliD [Enterobacter cancerogenus]MRG32906.1 flagellar filament capping protein FliD [Enterobacter cancerogenus]QXA51504.1 flagellar filament capping protein FliD [Enterobacter cancerogenus]QZY37258.1 flagellar filament capping protein FliD [Enterobacter cancerogenus]
MADFSSIDPQTLAQQMAMMSITALQNQLGTKTSTLNSQQKALDSLRTALTDFRSAMSGLNGTGSGMLKNAATTSRDGVATVTAGTTASKGTYNIQVNALASAHQVGFDGMSDEYIKNASGTLDITVGEETLTVDLTDMSSLSDLTKAINGNEDNPGVTASLMRTDGKVTLMLSSDESGVANEITVGGSAGFGQGTLTPKEISPARDAELKMGDMTFTSSSNKLDKLIEGVTIDLTATTDGKPLTITVGTDTAGTTEQLQGFIDSYNTLKDTLKKLTQSGNDKEERGAFAGDATISSLDRELNDTLRKVFGDARMSDFGITADKDGKLELDSKKLDEALKADPHKINDLFNGKEGLLSGMDKSLDRYLNSTNGLLKGRQEVLDRQQGDIDTKTEAMNARYESSYNRYLKQFTQLQKAMTSMNSTMSMFGLA